MGAEQPGERRLGTLTSREREVLQLIAEGLSSKEVAERLGVATKTADAHRTSLMKKLGVHKASCLVRLAIREGLIAP
jgi:DNA-binding NarL/FixJ family response regulator